jgi:hypothetical protein
MKYIKSFQSHKEFRKSDTVNEELLGGVINFFKNLWNKALAELDKLGENPKQEEVSSWISKNALNPSDDTYMFKQQMDDFKKKPEANDQDCLTLVDGILNPETGALGKQGLEPMMDALNKKYPPIKGEPMHWIPADIQFVFQTIRNKAIVKYKFAGGPADGKIDQKKINVDLKDMTHLPDVKKILTAATDGKKKKDAIINWVEKTLVPQLIKFDQEITIEQLNKNLADKKITFTGTKEGDEGEQSMNYEKLKEFFDKKTPVIYKLKDFKQEEWDKLSDDEKAKPDEEPASKLVGVKIINALNDQDNDESVTFLDKDEKPTIKKGYSDIIGSSTEKAEGQEDLVKTLGDVKTKNPEAIGKLDKIAKLYQDPEANKAKIEEIEKQLGGE